MCTGIVKNMLKLKIIHTKLTAVRMPYIYVYTM